MRCCTTTYTEQAPLAHESQVGDVLPCQWCSSQMVVADGPNGPRWQWDHPIQNGS